MTLATILTTSQSSPTRVTSVTPLAASIRARVERVYTISAKLKGHVLGTGRTEKSENKERDVSFREIVQRHTNIYHSGVSHCSK